MAYPPVNWLVLSSTGFMLESLYTFYLISFANLVINDKCLEWESFIDRIVDN